MQFQVINENLQALAGFMLHTAVSTKVVQKKRKSVRDNAER